MGWGRQSQCSAEPGVDRVGGKQENGNMFLRPQRKCIDGVCYEYWTLCESVRTDQGPRQRIVANLGKLTVSVQPTQVALGAGRGYSVRMATTARFKTGRPKRRRRTFSEIRRLIAEWEAGDLTQAQFASKHGVSTGTVSGWARRVRQSQMATNSARDTVSGGTSFVEVRLEADHEHIDLTPSDDAFELIFAHAANPGSGSVEGLGGQSTPAFHSLRVPPGFDPQALARLLGVLGQIHTAQS